VESGAGSSPGGGGLAAALRQRLLVLRDLQPRDWLMPLSLVGGGVLVGIALIGFERGTIPGILFFGWIGLLVWRRVRHPLLRLMQGFSRQMKKVPEVRIVCVAGPRITVVADRAVAGTYVRVNAALDGMNAKIFFGDPFTVAVRDDLTAEEEKTLLRGGGVVYVREDPASLAAK